MPEQQDILIDARRLVLTTTPEVSAVLRQLADEVERLRKQIKTMQREAREDAIDAAAEARWQERQGEDYGSY